MTPFSKLVRNLTQRWKGQYYEGPEPPPRLETQVVEFANHHPNATRAQWAEFATRYGQECYRTAYTRGVEWTERDLERRDPAIPPEAMVVDEDWTLPHPPQLESPDKVVPESVDEDEQVRREQAEFVQHETWWRENRMGVGPRR